MNNIEIAFEHPWLLLLAIPSIAIIVVPFLMLPARRRNTVKKIVPMVLHLLMVVMLVLILSGFTVVRNSDGYSTMVLVDLSDSTSTVQEEIMEHAQEIVNLIDKKEDVGVLAFGDDTVYALELGSRNRKIESVTVAADATNIDEALEYAVSQMPEDKLKRIILLSDGKETDGDANKTAQYLATQNVRIDAVYFDTTAIDTNEIQISSLTTPEGAYTGDPVTLTAELTANTDGAATVTLYDNETAIETREVSIISGSNLLEFTTVPEVSGIHTYRMELSAQADTIAENNEILACLNVHGLPAVLIIADTTANAATLESILSAENEVTVVSTFNVPRSITELCNYDEVILMNVNADYLPVNYENILEEYVSVYGRSLLAIGGDGTYMYGNMQETKFEEMLPVTFSLTEDSEGKSVALMLVLDCSSSMSRNTSYLSVAKQGAIKSVEAMSANDSVGVISFSSRASIVSGLIAATDDNKAILTRRISELTTSRGTYYTEGLELAYQELMKSTADSKHVIFLSDGNPSDYGYDVVVSQMASAGITVSTIGLGYSSAILANMATKGGGRYYYVSSAFDLPNIMLSETEQITVSSLITGSYTPKIAKNSELTEGYEKAKLPTLTGYLGTTIKEEATAYLTTNDSHPIYAAWQYGAGTVACFTSDLSGNWSSNWVSSQIGQTLIRRMVETTISDVHHESTFDMDITARGKSIDIAVKTTGENEDDTVTAKVTFGEESKTYTLFQTERGVFEGSVPAESVGVYELTITQTSVSGEVIDFEDTAVAVSYSAEYNVFAEGGENFLRNLCSYSNGVLTDNVYELMNLEIETITSLYNPLVLFGVLIAMMLLSDIAVRKVRWKDIKNYWYIFRARMKKEK